MPKALSKAARPGGWNILEDQHRCSMRILLSRHTPRTTRHGNCRAGHVRVGTGEQAQVVGESSLVFVEDVGGAEVAEDAIQGGGGAARGGVGGGGNAAIAQLADDLAAL